MDWKLLDTFKKGLPPEIIDPREGFDLRGIEDLSSQEKLPLPNILPILVKSLTEIDRIRYRHNPSSYEHQRNLSLFFHCGSVDKLSAYEVFVVDLFCKITSKFTPSLIEAVSFKKLLQ